MKKRSPLKLGNLIMYIAIFLLLIQAIGYFGNYLDPVDAWAKLPEARHLGLFLGTDCLVIIAITLLANHYHEKYKKIQKDMNIDTKENQNVKNEYPLDYNKIKWFK